MTREIVDHDALLDYDIAGLPYILQKNYIGSHLEELEVMMEFVSKQEILEEVKEVKRQLKRPIVAIQRYAKTRYAATYLNVDASYLTKRMGQVFTEGRHFFRPEGESIVRWDLEELEKWMRSEDKKDEINDFLSDLEV